jgi:hypothetical protein
MDEDARFFVELWDEATSSNPMMEREHWLGRVVNTTAPAVVDRGVENVAQQGDTRWKARALANKAYDEMVGKLRRELTDLRRPLTEAA